MKTCREKVAPRLLFVALVAFLQATGCSPTPSSGPTPSDSTERAAAPDRKSASDSSAALRDSTSEGRGTNCNSSPPGGNYPVVAVYFACEGGTPGQLYPVWRRVHDNDSGQNRLSLEDSIETAISGVLRGPTPTEEARGLRQRYSGETKGALLGVRLENDTLARIDFRSGLADKLSGDSGARSFTAVGLVGPLLWTVFDQFEGVDAVRFSLDGSERAFWQWLDEEGEPQAITREQWAEV